MSIREKFDGWESFVGYWAYAWQFSNSTEKKNLYREK